MKAVTATVLAVLPALIGCDERPETNMYPAGALVISAGQLIFSEGVKISYNSQAVHEGRPAAVLATASADPALGTVPWTTTTVPRGEVLPAFGKVYRLVDVSAKVAVLTVEDRTGTRDLFQRQDSLLLAPLGHLSLPGPGGRPAYFELLKVVEEAGGRKVAVLDSWSDLPKVSVLPGMITAVMVGEGDALVTGRASYKVLAIHPADADRQLPAWVEVDSRASDR